MVLKLVKMPAILKYSIETCDLCMYGPYFVYARLNFPWKWKMLQIFLPTEYCE